MKARYLFPDDYMADLSVHVFNGRLYISPSHDIETGAVFDDANVLIIKQLFFKKFSSNSRYII